MIDGNDDDDDAEAALAPDDADDGVDDDVSSVTGELRMKGKGELGVAATGVTVMTGGPWREGVVGALCCCCCGVPASGADGRIVVLMIVVLVLVVVVVEKSDDAEPVGLMVWSAALTSGVRGSVNVAGAGPSGVDGAALLPAARAARYSSFFWKI